MNAVLCAVCRDVLCAVCNECLQIKSAGAGRLQRPACRCRACPGWRGGTACRRFCHPHPEARQTRGAAGFAAAGFAGVAVGVAVGVAGAAVGPACVQPVCASRQRLAPAPWQRVQPLCVFAPRPCASHSACVPRVSWRAQTRSSRTRRRCCRRGYEGMLKTRGGAGRLLLPGRPKARQQTSRDAKPDRPAWVREMSPQRRQVPGSWLAAPRTSRGGVTCLVPPGPAPAMRPEPKTRGAVGSRIEHCVAPFESVVLCCFELESTGQAEASQASRQNSRPRVPLPTVVTAGCLSSTRQFAPPTCHACWPFGPASSCVVPV